MASNDEIELPHKQIWGCVYVYNLRLKQWEAPAIGEGFLEEWRAFPEIRKAEQSGLLIFSDGGKVIKAKNSNNSLNSISILESAIEHARKQKAAESEYTNLCEIKARADQYSPITNEETKRLEELKKILGAEAAEIESRIKERFASKMETENFSDLKEEEVTIEEFDKLIEEYPASAFQQKKT